MLHIIIKTCYKCQYKGFPRIADITIADYWGIENLAFNGVKYDITIFNNAVMINSVRGDCTDLAMQIVLDAPKSGEKVYVNGKETARYTVKEGKAYITVPFEAAVIQVQ